MRLVEGGGGNKGGEWLPPTQLHISIDHSMSIVSAVSPVQKPLFAPRAVMILMNGESQNRNDMTKTCQTTHAR